ncbi:hypothetical protein C7T94_09755 [Pedobacter yulinensis]|uniref:Uncharacterized protein n=1 Tax=Pedobacter yulinensis TaxID=2126353 RepID=A0A2T3HKG4_9SPHI|nr:hypothetical protein [Pedobacter yulinensis]PST82909.1 hypothetical protein C7T94_09755 [Pedobacter yulinensis]
MVRKLIAISLLIAVLAAQFSMSFIFAGFELNQEYIAKALCVNRSRPQLNCKGKCYLTNKLKQAQEKEQKQEKQAQKNLLQEGFANRVFSFRCLTVQLALFTFPQTSGSPVSRAGLIFHPPKPFLYTAPVC